MNRPDLYVPLSVRYATGRTGTAILDRYGLEGLAVWAALLAAAKTHRPEGRVTFYHEEDWASIGLAGHRPSFELKEFLAFLGRRKQTRTTRHGRTTYVNLTQWERWTKARDRETARQQKSRKRQESDPDMPPDTNRTRIGRYPDLEGEGEGEVLKGSPRSVASVAARSLNGASDRERAAERLLSVLSDRDAETGRVIASFGASAAVLEKVRESVLLQKPRSPAAYAVGALRSEKEERL